MQEYTYGGTGKMQTLLSFKGKIWEQLSERLCSKMVLKQSSLGPSDIKAKSVVCHNIYLLMSDVVQSESSLTSRNESSW